VSNLHHKGTIILFFNMFSSKLNSVIQRMSAVEKNRLQKFFDSPYLIPSKPITLLGSYIILHGEHERLMERTLIWQNVYGDEPFDYNRLRKTGSDCLRCIETFFVLEDMLKDPFEMSAKTTESISKREMSELFSVSIRQIHKLDSIYNYKSSRQFYHKYIVEYASFKMVNYDLKRFEKTNLSDITNNLDIFYVIEKLRYTCDALSRNPLSKEYDDFLLTNIIEKIKDNAYLLEVPAVVIYLSIYYTLTEDDDQHYYNLKSLLEKYGSNFEEEESKKFYESAINYVVDRSHRPDGEFQRELFELYKTYLAKGFIFVKQQLDPYNFKNIVTIALRLKEYYWVEYFLEEYKEKLPEIYRENVYRYHKAQLCFYTKDYGSVLKLLQEVEYDDLTYNLGAKSMLLAVYYETDEIEPLYSLLDSFKVYLNRLKKKLPKSTIENYSNLIKFTRKLTSIAPGNRQAIEKLKQDVSNTKSVASANWLYQKIEELE
jgi:hypothetical protein